MFQSGLCAPFCVCLTIVRPQSTTTKFLHINNNYFCDSISLDADNCMSLLGRQPKYRLVQQATQQKLLKTCSKFVEWKKNFFFCVKRYRELGHFVSVLLEGET